MDAVPVYPATTIPFEWVTIPAGEFLMGSRKKGFFERSFGVSVPGKLTNTPIDNDASDSELPQHKLYLPNYWIARVPVTNEQYKQFVEATSRPAPEYWQNGQIPKGKEKHPVVYVRWYDAVAFCDWAKVRLPTEAEWEKAARGTDGQIYPWGNELPDKNRCNFNWYVGDTTPVGNYPQGESFYGCFDMAGNVWEWTSTKWLSNYQDYASKVDNTLGGTEGRVLRGGAWGNDQTKVRCAYRNVNTPDDRYLIVGFRVVTPDAGTLASRG